MASVSPEKLKERVALVLRKHDHARNSTIDDGFGGDNIEYGAAGAFRSAGLSLLLDLYGDGHHHYSDFIQKTSRHEADEYEHARAIIETVREEIENGWLATTRSLMAGELFSDFLDMAQHLADETYDAAAAVIAGSSLEAHLRRLCGPLGIPVMAKGAKGTYYKKADTLNAELAKAERYSGSEAKQVTAWLGVRNDAAHGHYEKIIHGVVLTMVAGIRDFIIRHPA